MVRRLVPLVAVVVAVVVSIARPLAQSGGSKPLAGIFLVDASGAETKVKGTMSGDTQTHGVAKSFATQGILKPSYTTRFSGATAAMAITDPHPAFIFRLPTPKELSTFAQSDPMAMMTMMNEGDTMLGGTNPGAFALVRLSVDGDARVASSKGMESFKFSSSKRAAPREYDVKVTSTLEPGEYAFYVGKGMAPNAIWAFSEKAH